MVCSVIVSITGFPFASTTGFPSCPIFLHLLRLDQLYGVIRLEVLNDALRNQHQRSNNATSEAGPTEWPA